MLSHGVAHHVHQHVFLLLALMGDLLKKNQRLKKMWE
jgi:hypothetical protein